MDMLLKRPAWANWFGAASLLTFITIVIYLVKLVNTVKL